MKEKRKNEMAKIKALSPCPKGVKGTIAIPGDKSISHRSIMFSALGSTPVRITNFLHAADCLSTAEAMRALGARVVFESDTELIVTGHGLHGLVEPKTILDAGNSGTTLRLLLGMLAPQKFLTTFTGDASLHRRPMGRVVKPLMKMGARIFGREENTKLPLTIVPMKEQIHAMTYESPIASAQVKSAILLAGLYADSPTTVIEPAKSRDHTELMLKKFGANLNTTKTSATINPCKELFATDIDVPSDISSAAFFMAAATLVPDSELILENVGINPTRDGVIKVLKDMGANIEIINSNDEFEPVADIKVSYSRLHATTIGGDIIPTLIDELPLLAAVASMAEGKTIIKDATELKVKESNRIKVMCDELSKLGVNVVETEDGMEIEGTNKLLGNVTISTHDDHRIAMTFAVLGLISDGEIKLDNKNCVEISYPGFFEDLRKVNI